MVKNVMICVMGIALIGMFYLCASLLDERRQVKEDLVSHIDLIDDLGNMDTYCGSDSFERLYEFSHE